MISSRSFVSFQMYPRHAEKSSQKYKVPLGTWPKDSYMKTLGTFNLLQHLEGLEGIANVPLTKYGWSHEEIQVLLAKARADLKDRKIHSLFE